MRLFKEYIPVTAAAVAAVIYLFAMITPDITLTLVIVCLIISTAAYAVSKAYIKGKSIVFGIGVIANCVIMIVSAVYIVAMLLISSVVTDYVANLL